MLYIFDDYKLDTDQYMLLRDRTTLQIEPKVFDLLTYFLEHRGDVVTKETLLEQLWPDQFVTESALTYCIMAARKSIGDSGRAQRRIRTVHGRGYRFIGAVEERPESISDVVFEPAPKPTLAAATTRDLSAQADFTYWQKVAQRAIERVAHMEAIEALCQGIEVLKNDPEVPKQTLQDLTLQVTLNVALSANGTMDLQAKERAYLQMRELCHMPLADSPLLFQIQQGLWAYSALQADFSTAQTLGEACLQSTQSTQHPALSSWARYVLGLTLFEAGELPIALTHFEQCLTYQQPVSCAESRHGEDLSVGALAHAARAQWCLGEPAPALHRMDTALTRAHQQNQPVNQVTALISAAHFDHMRRDTTSAHSRAKAAVALAIQHNLPHWAAQGEVLLGWAVTAEGQTEGQIETGLERIRRGVAAYRNTGVVLTVPTLLAVQADATIQAGQFQESLAILGDALQMVDLMGGHYMASELHRLKGVCLGLENPDAAEDALRKAMDIAMRQQATLLELRAAVSLGELWQQQGNTAKISSLLMPRYDALPDTEGLIDAREAQRLLA